MTCTLFSPVLEEKQSFSHFLTFRVCRLEVMYLAKTFDYLYNALLQSALSNDQNCQIYVCLV